MKKIIFIMLVALLSVGTIYAQQPKAKGNAQKANSPTPEQKADRITTRLKTELSLTDEQTPKVKQSTLNRINQVAAAKTKAGEDKKAFGQERKTIFQNWEAEMKGILTTEQYTTYLAKKEEKKKKMQENKGAKKAGNALENEDLDEIGE